MTLKLDSKLRNRLAEVIAESLSDAKVAGGSILLFTSVSKIFRDRTLPVTGPLYEQLQAYIGDLPLANFLLNEISEEISSRPFSKRGEESLVQIPGYENLGEAASRLVASFESLPWVYRVVVRLPNVLAASLAAMESEFELSPKHRIVSGSVLRDSFPKPKKQLGLGQLVVRGVSAPGDWDVDARYLVVDTSGYIFDQIENTFLQAKEDVLTFFGLGLALGLFEYKKRILGGAVDKDAARHYEIYVVRDEMPVPFRAFDVDENHREVISELTLASKQTVLGSDEDWLRIVLEKIGSVYRSDYGRKGLASAAKWLFESYCGRDPLLQYVQAAVAMEILLGDEQVDENISLSTLMSNRCAYLIGRTPTARTNLMKLFRDIYRVRSKIVHRGHSRLNGKERWLFEEMRRLCKQIMVAEQRLLAAAERA